MNGNYKVIFTGLKQVELQECDIPTVADNQFLIKTEISQISTGTELTLLEGNVEKGSTWEDDLVYPLQPGYSTVGKIIAVGNGVPSDLIGRRVFALVPHQKYHVIHAQKDEDNYYFVPEKVKSAEAVFAAIAQITMGSIRASRIRPGDSCVVYGAGLIGQLVARNAKVAGSTKILVTDVSDSRLSMLPDDPCFIPINTKKARAVDVIKMHTNGRGADIVFETTSNPALIEEELSCLVYRGNGKLIITSSPKGKSLVDFDYCSRYGITIIGAHNYAVHTPVETQADRWTRKNDSILFFELLEKNMITVEETVTHMVDFKKAVETYEMLMKDRTQALGVLLNWGD